MTIRTIPASTQILLYLAKRRKARLKEIADAVRMPLTTVRSAVYVLMAEDLVGKEGEYIVITEKGKRQVKETLEIIERLLGRVSGGCLAVAVVK